MLANTRSSFRPRYMNSERDVMKDANNALPSTNSLFTQRAQQSPLATSILVYLPGVPSYRCHGNGPVAMPVFRCHCVVFVAAPCGAHLPAGVELLRFPTSVSMHSVYYAVTFNDQAVIAAEAHPYLHMRTRLLGNC